MALVIRGLALAIAQPRGGRCCARSWRRLLNGLCGAAVVGVFAWLFYATRRWAR